MNLDDIIKELREIRDEMNRCTDTLEQREIERLRAQMNCMNETDAERRARLRFGYQKPYSED